jgi:hypothetical protein
VCRKSNADRPLRQREHCEFAMNAQRLVESLMQIKPLLGGRISTADRAKHFKPMAKDIRLV